MSSPEIYPRFKSLLDHLRKDLFEKEKVIRLGVLAIMAGESIFLLGPPGVAKSLIARRLKYLFTEAKAFEYLMGKFSTPDEVFGPVSISKLKSEDKYERLITHYLPGAQIVFLDEIWKASPAIQNSLLTVLNEKIFRNGEHEIQVDLRGIIAASNELPLTGEGLDALWDRFLIRMSINNIQEEGTFQDMLRVNRKAGVTDPVPVEEKISSAQYHKWKEQIEGIEIPDYVMAFLHYFRKTLRDRNARYPQEEQIYVSDRRWWKIAQLMRTSAFLHGRSQVELIDCFLIMDCIWQLSEQIEETEKMVEEAMLQYGYQGMLNLQALKKGMDKILAEVKKETEVKHKRTVTQVKDYMDKGKNPYVRVLNYWSNDDVFLRKSDWNSMEKDEESFIPIFENAQNTFRPFQTFAFTKTGDFSLMSKRKKLSVETEEVVKEITSLVPPTPEAIDRWNQQSTALTNFCQDKVYELEARKQQDEDMAAMHLFVDRKYVGMIRESLEKAIVTISHMKLEINKNRHHYESISASTE
ncbi:MAG: AAA family ATPase [Bacteroidota bacterium]